eukprot:PhM_4_TR5241/c0_g1_i1/m.42287/K04487/iscS, NFS1; cysteine desulfurase
MKRGRENGDVNNTRETVNESTLASPTRRVYLDYNATTPLCDEALAALINSAWGNCSSPHFVGAAAKQSLEETRAELNQLMGVPEKGLTIFTSGGTESNNLAIVGAFRFLRDEGKGNHIVSSNVEHPSVATVLKYLEDFEGAVISYVPVNERGLLATEDVVRALRPSTVLVTLMHANNEVGTIFPIAEVAAKCHERGIFIHTDCAQSIGKIPVSMTDLGVDFLSVCGHKFYGPKGSGALCCSEKALTVLSRITHGAGHERGYRPGTESVMLARCLTAAVKFSTNNLSEKAKHMFAIRAHMKEFFERRVKEVGADIEIETNNVFDDTGLPNTWSVAVKHRGEYITAALFSADVGDVVAISAGSACHATEVHISHVLKAMKMSDARALATLRISVGFRTTKEEVEFAASEIIRRLVESVPEQTSS